MALKYLTFPRITKTLVQQKQLPNISPFGRIVYNLTSRKIFLLQSGHKFRKKHKTIFSTLVDTRIAEYATVGNRTFALESLRPIVYHYAV